MQQESIYIPVPPTDSLHLKWFYTDKGGAPVFLVHGSIENGHVFILNQEKALLLFWHSKVTMCLWPTSEAAAKANHPFPADQISD